MNHQTLADNASKEINKPVILFDGLCQFCNNVTSFVIHRDKEKKFLYSSVQTREARSLLRENNLAFINLKTIYLVEGNEIYQRSEAIFRIFKLMPYPWKALSYLKILPLSLTNFFYKIFSKYCSKLYGQIKFDINSEKEIKENLIDNKKNEASLSEIV